MTHVTTVDDGKRLTLSFGYDADAVSRLKDVVPGWDRQFDPQTKRWTIGRAWLPKLTESLKDGGHTIGDEPPVLPKKSPDGIGGFFGIDDPADDGYDVDGIAVAIIMSIPPQHRGKIFRAIGRHLYPDMYPKRKR